MPTQPVLAIENIELEKNSVDNQKCFSPQKISDGFTHDLQFDSELRSSYDIELPANKWNKKRYNHINSPTTIDKTDGIVIPGSKISSNEYMER